MAAVVLLIAIALACSGVVLIPICISLRHENKTLRDENYNLRMQYYELLKKLEDARKGIIHDDAPPKEYAPPKEDNPAADIGAAEVSHEKTEQTEQTHQNPPGSVHTVPSPQQYSRPAKSYDMSYIYPSAPGSENAAKSTYAPPPPAPQKSSCSSPANAIMIIGSMFVTLAGIIFASAVWVSVPDMIRVLILFSFSAVFFILNRISEKKLGLKTTGVVFFVLGSIFVPTALIGCGIFSLFGDWFSFSGDGKYTFCSLIAVSAAVMLYIAGTKYDKDTCKTLALNVLSAAVMLNLWQFFKENQSFALIISVYSALIIFTARPVGTALKSLIPDYELFAFINMAISSAVTMFISGSGPAAFAACALSAAAFASPSARKKGEYVSVIPFAAMLCISSVKLFADYDSYRFEFFTLITVICAVLSVTGLFGENGRKFLSVISAAAALPAVLFNLGNTVSNDDYLLADEKLVYLICTLIVTAEAVFLQLRGNKAMKYFTVPFAVIASYQFGSLVLGSDYSPIAAGMISVGIYFAFICFEKLRSRYNDVILISSVILSAALLPDTKGIDSELRLWISAVYFLAAAGMMIISANSFADKEKTLGFLRFTVIPAVMASSIVLSRLDMFWSEEITVIYCFLFLCTAAYIVTVCTEKAPRYRIPLLADVIICSSVFYIYGLSTVVSDDNFRIFYLLPFSAALAAAYTAVSFLRKKTDEAKRASSLRFLSATAAACLFTPPSLLVPMPENSAALILLTFVPGAILTIGAYILSRITKTENRLLFLPSAILLLPVYALTASQAMPDGITGYILIFVLAAVMNTAGRFLFPHKLSDEHTYDTMFICSGAAVPLMFATAYTEDLGEYAVWFVWLAAALYFFSYIGKLGKDMRPVTDSIGAGMLCIAYYAQPFMAFSDIPDYLTLIFEITGAAVYLAVLRLIWKDRAKSDIFWFVCTIILMIKTGIHAFESELVSDAVITGVILLVIMIVSHFRHSKRWFMLSVTGTVVFTLIITNGLWISKFWWLYLLAVGIGLIGWGIRNEAQKKRKADAEAMERVFARNAQETKTESTESDNT